MVENGTVYMENFQNQKNVEKPAQESFSVSKTVDGSTPTVDQKFVFRLEQIGDVPNGTTPISAKTVENNGAKVDFGRLI